MEPNETPLAAARAYGGQDDAETFEVQQLKAMEQPNWNEARLDDLNEKVEKGFEKVEKGFEKVDQRFEKVDQRFGKIEDELKGMQRLMVQGVIGLATLSGTGFAAMVVLIVALMS